MKEVVYYNCKSNGSGYHLTKFDEDLNPISEQYDTSLAECTCKAGVRPTCRHRQMLPLFQHLGRVNTGWFFEFDSQRWYYLDQMSGGLVAEKRVKGWWRRA